MYAPNSLTEFVKFVANFPIFCSVIWDTIRGIHSIIKRTQQHSWIQLKSIICTNHSYAGIYVTFVGNAETLWSENSGDKRIAYRGKECYLSKRIYFVGEEDGNFEFRLSLLLIIYYYCYFFKPCAWVHKSVYFGQLCYWDFVQNNLINPHIVNSFTVFHTHTMSTSNRVRCKIFHIWKYYHKIKYSQTLPLQHTSTFA